VSLGHPLWLVMYRLNDPFLRYGSAENAEGIESVRQTFLLSPASPPRTPQAASVIVAMLTPEKFVAHQGFYDPYMQDFVIRQKSY
jgi:hypothetical protein